MRLSRTVADGRHDADNLVAAYNWDIESEVRGLGELVAVAQARCFDLD